MGRPASFTSDNLVHRAGELRFRFPCGHTEGVDSVDRRVHVAKHAVWVRCRACNVIELVIARPGRA